MNGLNPTWLFHQSTLFSINCGSHAAIYFFLLTVEIAVHMIVVGAEDVSIIVMENVVPVVVTIRVIKTVVLHSVEVICSGIVLVVMRVIMVVTVRVLAVVAALVPLVVLEHVEIVPEHVLTVVLVPPTQDFKYN